MENLLCLLIPLLLWLWGVLTSSARAKKQREALESGGEEAYTASTEDIKRFLRSIGVQAPGGEETPPPPSAPRAPAGMPTGTVTPSAPRVRVRVSGGIRPSAQPPRWPPTPPPPVPQVQEEEETTRRLVSEDEHLAPTIEPHLQERRLGEGEATLTPTVEEHLRGRRLDTAQAPIVPTIEAHLRTARLEGVAGPQVARKAASRGVTAALGRTGARGRGVALPPLTRDNLKQAFVMSEILQPPVGLRDPRTASGRLAQ